MSLHNSFTTATKSIAGDGTVDVDTVDGDVELVGVQGDDRARERITWPETGTVSVDFGSGYGGETAHIITMSPVYEGLEAYLYDDYVSDLLTTDASSWEWADTPFNVYAAYRRGVGSESSTELHGDKPHRGDILPENDFIRRLSMEFPDLEGMGPGSKNLTRQDGSGTRRSVIEGVAFSAP